MQRGHRGRPGRVLLACGHCMHERCSVQGKGSQPCGIISIVAISKQLGSGPHDPGWQEHANSDQGPATGDRASSDYHAGLGRHEREERGPADRQCVTKVQPQCSGRRFKGCPTLNSSLGSKIGNKSSQATSPEVFADCALNFSAIYCPTRPCSRK